MIIEQASKDECSDTRNASEDYSLEGQNECKMCLNSQRNYQQGTDEFAVCWGGSRSFEDTALWRGGGMMGREKQCG